MEIQSSHPSSAGCSQLWMGTLSFYGTDDSSNFQLRVNHSHSAHIFIYIRPRQVLKDWSEPVCLIVRLIKTKWLTKRLFCFCFFVVNKLGVQPTIIAQPCRSHRLSAFTQAVICIRLFAFVCSVWHFLLSHKAAAIIWEWKGPPGMPGQARLCWAGPGWAAAAWTAQSNTCFITATCWFTPAQDGGNHPHLFFCLAGCNSCLFNFISFISSGGGRDKYLNNKIRLSHVSFPNNLIELFIVYETNNTFLNQTCFYNIFAFPLLYICLSCVLTLF